VNPEQIGPFLKQVALTDPRILPNDEQEAIAAIALWAVSLADVDDQFALNAVARHYGQSPYLVKPSDIAAQWRTHVRNRAERYVDPVPTADPDNITAYNAELLAGRRSRANSTPRAALGPGKHELAALTYQEEDLGAMRLEGDLKRMWAGVGKQAKADNERRKRLVLAHPDLAERLGKPPINIRPDAWSGFVAQEIGASGINNSPIRRALAALVAEAERRADAALQVAFANIADLAAKYDTPPATPDGSNNRP
jgi:hypothetical protein